MNDKKRHQNARISIRLTKQIKDRLERDAEQAGLSLSGLVKFRTLGQAAAVLPTKQKRISADLKLLRQILGELGKIGSNQNQIARRLNSGNHTQIEKTGQQVIQWKLESIRKDILTALGVINDC
ncbi:MAG TPA: plasmid mobilization relaxosome protein MobC [Oceanospirillales bacterium]|nr:plasmid mobilization relaxosome protein MobC [Oceanospirillales bacterium]